MLDGVIADWHLTADGSDWKLLKQAVDKHLKADGSFDFSGADAVAFGVPVVTLYRVTLDARYWKAATAIHDALAASTASIPSPEESYQAATFLAAYAATGHTAFDEVVEAVKPHTAPGTASSQAVKADAPAWHIATVVDVLCWMPEDVPARPVLLEELRHSAPSVSKAPAGTGDVVATRIRAYALLKGIRKGWIAQNLEAATVKQATILRGGASSSEIKGQDMREAAAAMLLSSELAQTETQAIGHGKTVAVDGWFNSQLRKSATGGDELFHYKWDDDANSGFAFFGRAFERYGVKLATTGRPTADSLQGEQVYIIASPDIPSKNPKPNYVTPQDVDAIAKWVGNGGVLLLMQNDGQNAEFEHFNTLSERFGIHFNVVVKNTVEGTKWEQGKILIPAQTTTVFHDAHTAYMKEICTISTQQPAKPVLRDMLHDSGDVYMAIAKYGKGTVYAVVDPWLYNEYVDGRKLPVEYDQFASAKELARWAVEQAK
jgi:unsaturated rhamnogalacturonyl hydrolase